jgi:hypothetical protein
MLTVLNFLTNFRGTKKLAVSKQRKVRILFLRNHFETKRQQYRPKYIKEGSAMSDVTFHFSKGGKKSWREL